MQAKVRVSHESAIGFNTCVRFKQTIRAILFIRDYLDHGYKRITRIQVKIRISHESGTGFNTCAPV